jgi:hypothetical protein
MRPASTRQPLTLGLDSVEQLRAGITARVHLIKFDKADLELTTFEMPDGKLDQYLIFSDE